ncbi:PPE family protein [Mycobacterium simiae]|uniref:PPE family protein n=1 Tax=Mycobacterium simiae TaxID=1784 RepID=A0A5B1BV81_MYCSI|nr:PPE family protein [Mycobacterium simiae]KAA1251154.1 PPE family protein [Mycobacterium simiae]
MDYAFLPPEINSARMYSGPGPGSLLAAARSWDMIAVELTSAADGYGSVLSCLTAMYWWGPASAAMLATATPLVEWLQSTASQAEQSANQARAAAVAFEQAYAMTVPPPAIAANRAQLQVLIATNFFGQNTAAIAATEAQYAEMWAQDAAAMYGYATNSAAATQLTPFCSPQQSTNPDGLPAQRSAVNQAVSSSTGSAATVLSRLSALVPQALQAVGDWPNILPEDFTILDAIFAVYATVGVSQDVESFAAGIIGAENSLGLLGTGENPAELVPGGLSPVFSAAEKGAGAGLSNAVTVSMSRAGSIGPLSVPPSWTAPSAGPAAAISGSGLTTIPGTEVADHGMPGAPGMPTGTMKRASSVVPRYGVRLTVMSRPPAAG